VPKGSRAQVVETPNNKGGTVVTLKVWGLTAKKKCDACVYTRPCGATPAAAGKRTQNGPSTEHYPQNEIWLDYSSQKMQIA
jgi:superoxide dismutase, Cu-Zn family